MAIFAAALILVVLLVISVSPSDITLDFAYWIGFTAATIYVYTLLQFDDIPGQKKLFSSDSRLIIGSPFFIGALLVVIRPTAHVGIGFFTGNFFGFGFGIVMTALTSRQMNCPRCREYRVFVKFRGSKYCNACGTQMPEPGILARVMPEIETISDGGLLSVVNEHAPARPSKSQHCRVCRAELVLQHSDTEGRSANVELALHNLPCLSCPNGHEKIYPFGDFALFLLEDIHRSIPKVSTKGVTRRTNCFNCGNTIDSNKLRRTRFTAEFHWEHWDTFSLTITLPSAQCQACHKEQRLSDPGTDSNISDALLNAFSNLGMSRS